MSRIERVGDLNGKRQEHLGFQWAPSDAVLQHHAVQKLHDNEWLTILLPDFIDRADIGMVQRRCSFGFTPKSLQSLAILGYVFG
jgi:hypothetical protein